MGISNRFLGITALFFIILFACNTPKKADRQSLVVDDITTENDIWGDSLVVVDESIAGLRIYYPRTAAISWVFADEPDTTREYLCFVCAASYTKKSFYKTKAKGIKHSDIAGCHISDGVLFEGYSCENNTGGFVSYGYNVEEDGKMWDILDREAYLKACQTEPLPHDAFTQELLIYRGERKAFYRPDIKPEYYRALCRLDDNLCIIDGTHKHMLTSFVDLLLNAGVEDALYLDMGDWKYSWMRKYPDFDNRFKVDIIYDKPKGKEYYGTNWLVFYYVN